MRFKHPRQHAEFMSEDLDPRVRLMVLAAVGYADWKGFGDAMVTEVWRSRSEQERIYPDAPDKRSVHEFWRGVDIRGAWTEAQYKELERFLDDAYVYGGKHSVAWAHDAGSGYHLHIQAPAAGGLPFHLREGGE